MPKNNQQISLTPDQLTSLISIASVMPVNRRAVLLAILSHTQPNTLKSSATREQIKHQTGLGLRTIYSCIKEFEACDLIKTWRGPFETKQKFYRINLPAPHSVFEYYGEPDATKKKRPMAANPLEIDQIIEDQGRLKEPLCKNTVSETNTGNLVTVGEDVKGAFYQDCSGSPSAEPQRTGSSEASGLLPEASTDLAEISEPASYQELAQDTASDISDNYDFDGSVMDPTDSVDDHSEPYFDDPLLDLLVAQVEQGKKLGARVHKWLQSQNFVSYWPPDDNYRVERRLLLKKARTLDELNTILTAPVRHRASVVRDSVSSVLP